MSAHHPSAGPDDLANPAGVPAAPSGPDRPGEEDRRRQLDTMNLDDVRSLAATMPLIEQAKGVLMGCYGCDATAAFAVLNRVSSSHNVKLRDLAGLVVGAASTPVGTGQRDAPSPCEQVRRVLQELQLTAGVSTTGRTGTGTSTDQTSRRGRE